MSDIIIEMEELKILRATLGLKGGGSAPKRNHFIARYGRREYFRCLGMRRKGRLREERLDEKRAVFFVTDEGAELLGVEAREFFRCR